VNWKRQFGNAVIVLGVTLIVAVIVAIFVLDWQIRHIPR
jgi:hypothetical protein